MLKLLEKLKNHSNQVPLLPPIHASSSTNAFSMLPVSEPTTDSLSLIFPSPYQRIYQLPAMAGTTQSSILSSLNLMAHDVPPDGDCFYLAIQLYLSKVHPQATHLAASQLRQALYQFLTTTNTGKHIFATTTKLNQR